MEEHFATFDESGNPLGITPRTEAHKRGLWHRASNIFLFFPDGRLLIQKRQLTKDTCPGAWDVSAAEHLKPGETFSEGAMRGLKEELGITGITLEPFGSITQFRLVAPEIGVKDYEFQQSFRTEYNGTIVPDASEVMDTRVITLRALDLEILEQPEAFTPWFRQRTTDLDLFRHPNGGGGPTATPPPA